MYNFPVRIKSTSFTLCPLPFPRLSKEGLLSEAGLPATLRRGMPMKSLLYCFSPHDGAEDNSPPWRHESSHSSLGRYICRSVHTDARAETRTMYWEGLFWTTSTNNPPAIWNTYFHVYKLNSLRLRCLHWRDANLCNGLSWVGIFN